MEEKKVSVTGGTSSDAEVPCDLLSENLVLDHF